MLSSTPTRGVVPTTPEPIYFTHEAALYQFHIWTGREWTSIPVEARPRLAEYLPPLGWVGGEFVEVLNSALARYKG